MKPLRGIVVGGIVAALAAFGAAPALGAIRYASPTGSGAEPCNPTACSLVNAVNNASDGDQVVVASGTYTVGAELDVKHAVEVGGQSGEAMPVVHLGTHQFHVENAGAVLHDLRVELTEPEMAYALVLDGGTVERVFATSRENGGDCSVSAGLLRDFVCWGRLVVSAGEPGMSHVTLRNVTATPLLIGASPGGELSLDAANVIAHSPDSEHADVEVDVSAGGAATATFAHSNYATVDTSLSAGTNYTYTAPGTDGNQTAAPQFVDAAAGDFQELSTSPTVDAGLTDSLIGTADLLGNPRSLPSCIGGTPAPDIGAYEYVPTVECPKPSNAFSFGKLKLNRKKGTARLAVTLPWAGTLALAGKGIVARPARAVSAGHATLTIKAKGKWKRALLRKGHVKLKALVTFTPTGGDAHTRGRKLRLVRKLRRR